MASTHRQHSFTCGLMGKLCLGLVHLPICSFGVKPVFNKPSRWFWCRQDCGALEYYVVFKRSKSLGFNLFLTTFFLYHQSKQFDSPRAEAWFLSKPRFLWKPNTERSLKVWKTLLNFPCHVLLGSCQQLWLKISRFWRLSELMLKFWLDYLFNLKKSFNFSVFRFL